jgi:hypothetical protein
MTDIYARLGEVGFPKAYVRDRILPDWWDDGLASDPGNRRLAELAISRTLKIPLAKLVDADAALSLKRAAGVRFKRWKDADEDKLAPAVAIARRVCELLLSCAKALPDLRLEGFTAEQLRERVLSQQQYIHFPALLRYAWDFGVPVVHLEALPKGSKRVDGMALMISGRPCIVLASSKRSPAWMIWHLAHELGLGEEECLPDCSASSSAVSAVARTLLRERIDLDALSDTDRHFFVCATGLVR